MAKSAWLMVFSAHVAMLIFGVVSPLSAEPVNRPSTPSQVVIAGDRVMVMDRENALWSRADSSDKWIRLGGAAEFGAMRQLLCSADGDGNCAILIGNTADTEIGYITKESDKIVPTGIKANTLIGIFNKGQITFARALPEKKREVFMFDVTASNVVSIGILQAKEQGLVRHIENNLQVIGVQPDGRWRLVREKTLSLWKPFNRDNPIPTKFGSLHIQGWHTKSIPHEDTLRFFVGTFVKGEEGNLKPKIVEVRLPHASKFLPFSDSMSSSSEGDLFSVGVGAAGKVISVLCNSDNNSLAFSGIKNLKSDETVYINSSPAGKGAIFITHSPRHSPKYERFKFLDSAPIAFGKRKCAGQRYSISPLWTGNPSEQNQWIVATEKFQAPDGTELKAVILRPHAGLLKNVIIDVYGAFGIQRWFSRPADAILSRLAQSNTGLVFAVVRGDGDLGFNFAMSSRTPNRFKAVDDVVTVAEYVKKALLVPNGRITVRGASAGGWLVMNATLKRPDLFAGAVSHSGAYLFSDNKEITNGGFFSPFDSLDNVFSDTALKERCVGRRFVLIHGKKDLKTSFDQALAYYTKLLAVGCQAKLITIDDGGHFAADATIPDALNWGGQAVAAYHEPL